MIAAGEKQAAQVCAACFVSNRDLYTNTSPGIAVRVREASVF
jgi:hypothetical protein